MTTGADDEWFPLVELTQRLAELVWVERSVAELLQGWSEIEAHPGSRIAMHQAGRHHAWHADVLAECLPTSDALVEVASPGPPTPGWANAVELLAGLAEPDRSGARLAAIVRQFDPWLVRETTALIDLARPIAEGHVLRWLRFVEIDHHEDGQAFAELLAEVESRAIDLADRSLLAQIDLRA